jgi:hypothetical protein
MKVKLTRKQKMQQARGLQRVNKPVFRGHIGEFFALIIFVVETSGIGDFY